MRHSIVILFALLFGFTILYGQPFNFDFEDGYQEWIADFADYSVGDSANWNFNQYHQAMPNITPLQNGLRMVGDNFSDDLFFFIKRKIEGLQPNTEFQIIFSIDIVTNMPPDGVGGSDLMLKAGATVIEPQKIIVEEAGIQYYRMNINKGNQSQPGADMDTLGHVNHDVPGNFTYHLVNYNNAMKLFKLISDSKGELWVIIGAESQWETSGAEFLVANIEFNIDNVTSIEEPEEIPTDFELFQNYPNPFNPTTNITYSVPQSDAFGNLKLEIYNLPGQKIRTLVNKRQRSEIYTVQWDGKNDFGLTVSNGLYLYRLSAGSFVQTKKMLFIK